MLKEEQVQQIVRKVGDTLKNKGRTYDHAQKSYDWSDGYKDACEFAEQIKVHAEIGAFPEKLMVAKAPNETAEELAYRKAIFESVTVPYWHKAENSLNRIWAEQNYKIAYGSDDAKEYYTSKYPIYGSIINYFQSVVTKEKIRDPNAVMVLDFDLPVKELAEGEVVVDQAKALEPYGFIYCAEDVLMFELGDYALFMSREKSMVEWGNSKKAAKGYVLYLYDDENIYRIEQTGKYVDFKFTSSVYYKHELEYLPCWKLGGIPYEVHADNPIYQSYFIGAIPHLNTALKNNSTLDLSINKCAYPIRNYYESKCTHKGCVDGRVFDDAKGQHVDCPTCKGRGKMQFSPGRDIIQTPPANAAEDTGNQLPFPAFAYVSPDTGILEFNKTKIREDIIEAFTFINIDLSSDATANGAEATATEIRIDRDEFYTFLLKFSNEAFMLLSNLLAACNAVRYNDEKVTATVSPPKSFDLITAAELTQELSNANIPAIAKEQLIEDYLINRFTQQGNLVKKMRVLKAIDPYLFTPVLDLLALKAQGAVLPWQIVLHNEAASYIDDEIRANADFLDTDVIAIRTKLQERAKAAAATLTQARDAASIVNELAGGGAA